MLISLWWQDGIKYWHEISTDTLNPDWSDTDQKSGRIRVRENWANIISDSVFLPLIGLLLSSYSSLGVSTPVGSPLLRSEYFSELFPLSLYPSTAGSSTWNWWAVLLLRTGERESHPGTGGRGSIRWEGREPSRVSHHIPR